MATLYGVRRSGGQGVWSARHRIIDRGLAEYVPNPAHRRAKLLSPTQEGRTAVSRIDPGHAEFAARLAAELGEAEFAETARVLERLSAAVEAAAAEAVTVEAVTGNEGGDERRG